MTGDRRDPSFDDRGLDELLRRSLRAHGVPGAVSASGDVDHLLARGRARRRRRAALVPVAGVAVAALLGAVAVVANRPDGRVRVAVGGGSGDTVVDPTIVASTTVSTVSTTAASVAPPQSPAGTTSTPGTTVATPAIPTAAPDFVAVRDGQFEVFAHGAPIGRFDPCAGQAGCDVPVVSLGSDLFYLQRAGTRRNVVVRSSDGSELIALQSGPGRTIIDAAYGGRSTEPVIDHWFTIEAADPADAGGPLVAIDSATTDGTVSTVADRAYEVAATTDGRLAWVADDGIVLRDPVSGTTRTIGLGRYAGRPTQLSFGPAGTTWLLVRAPGDAGRRLVLDTATAATLDDAHPFAATAACWSSSGPIIGYTGSVAASGALVRVDPTTGASTPYFADRYRTEQIACADDGTIALVDHAGGSPTGDLVLVGTDGTPTRLAGPYERVRSIR